MSDVVDLKENGSRRFVIALDCSTHSEHALRWALTNKIAAGKDEVILLMLYHFHPVHRSVVFSALGKSTPSSRKSESDIINEEVKRIGLHDYQLAMARYVDICQDSGIEEPVQILETIEESDKIQSLQKRIVDIVAAQDPTLLLLGNRGFHGLNKLIAGSVSDYCMKHAPCPVMVVRQEHQEHQEHHSSDEKGDEEHNGFVDQPPRIKPNLHGDQLAAFVEAKEEMDAQKVKLARDGTYDAIQLGFVNDKCLRRYLVARKWNVDNALKALWETLEWRKTMGVDRLLLDDIEMLKKQNERGKMYVHKTDRLGHPIICMHPAREKLQHHEHNIKHLVYHMERAIASMDTAKGVEKLCICMDFSDYSIRNAPPFKTSKATLDILMYHYPERLYRAYLNRPPWAFSLFWKMIWPLIDPVTREKVAFVQGSRDVRRQKLAETIDLSSLSVAFDADDEFDFPNPGVFEQYWADDKSRIAAYKRRVRQIGRKK